MGIRLTKILNLACDEVMHAGAKVRIRSWSPFTIMGVVGFLLAVGLITSLGILVGRSTIILIILVTVGLVAFLTSAMVIKILVGEERLTLYHHKIVVILSTATLLKILGQPVLPYLDLMLLGIGIFAVSGRFGCLLVACCHGRPNRWGVRYGTRHSELGMDPIYVGIRVIPIQVIEALWMLSLVLVGAFLILRAAVPGEVLSWYFVIYGFGRFWFEFLRADAERGYLWGFSEAQWTSLLLMLIVSVAECFGRLPLHSWHIVATALLGLIMFAISLQAHFRRTTQRLSDQPGHIGEIAEAIQFATSLALNRCDVCKHNIDPPLIHLGQTSLGFQVTASKIRRATDSIYHYAFSCTHRVLTKRTLTLATEIVVQMTRSTSIELKKEQSGVFHLLVQSQS